MKTISNTTKNGITATATEFYERAAAIRFMIEKKKQGYATTYPCESNANKFIVYTWRKEQ